MCDPTIVVTLAARLLCSELDTPQAICGYVAPSVAYTVAERWPKLTMTVDEVNEMVKHLRDYKNVMPTMRNMM